MNSFNSEIINVTFFPNIAQINATYTFKNSSPNETQLSILLPFGNIPTNISLTRSGVNVSYIEQDHDELDIPLDTSFSSVTSISPDHMIQFQLSFMGGELITISTVYERQYSFRSKYYLKGYYYNEFRYIIGTTRWWNHTVDNAHFEFRIKQEEYDTGGINTSGYFSPYGGLTTNFQLTTEAEFYVLSTTYTNWLPEEDIFLIVSWKKKRSDSIIPFSTISFFLCMILVSFQRKKRKNRV